MTFYKIMLHYYFNQVLSAAKEHKTNRDPERNSLVIFKIGDIIRSNLQF